jgi:ubiquitin carboxyl-terminal hydrolase 34
VKCLWFLRDNYVVRNVEVTERAVNGLQRVVMQCSKYFNLKEPAEDDEARDFAQLKHSKYLLILPFQSHQGAKKKSSG